MLILAHRIFYNPNDTTLVLYSSLLGLGSPKAALALDSAKAARLPVPATAYCCDSISAFGGAGGNAKSPVSPLAMVGVVVCHFKACLALSSFSICFTLACFLATASSCRFTCHPQKKEIKNIQYPDTNTQTHCPHHVPPPLTNASMPALFTVCLLSSSESVSDDRSPSSPWSSTTTFPLPRV